MALHAQNSNTTNNVAMHTHTFNTTFYNYYFVFKHTIITADKTKVNIVLKNFSFFISNSLVPRIKRHTNIHTNRMANSQTNFQKK